MAPAVLLLIFNRPDCTRQVFERIRQAQPLRLYIAADGPRPGRPEDPDLCQQARAIATEVDWPCEIHTLFQDTNLGCRKAVTAGINWFFDHEPEGIILEDDCVPDPSFFTYCAHMLEKYRHDPRIMHIAGSNYTPIVSDYPYSYYYSAYTYVWGWATWRRAWKLYDADMKHYADFLKTPILHSISSTTGFAGYWKYHFDAVYHGRIDSWAYIWTYSCFANHGLSCIPKVNLVTNIGHGSGATHTTDRLSRLADLPAHSLTFPLSHPATVCRNHHDALDDRKVYHISRLHFLKRLKDYFR